MRRINLTNVPDEVYELLEKDGKLRRETVPATVLRICCDRLLSVSTPHGVNGNTRPTQPRHKADKFVPPTVAEAGAEIKAKGYHFGAEEFVAWNGARGWKTRQGPMKDWRAAMVTWEGRWKEKNREQMEQSNPFGRVGPKLADAAEIRRQQDREARARGDID